MTEKKVNYVRVNKKLIDKVTDKYHDLIDAVGKL